MSNERRIYIETDDPADGALGLALGEPDKSGELFVYLDVAGDRHTAEVESFNAHPSRNGIGTALMAALVAELKARNIMELWSVSATPEAIGMRLKIFGEKAIQFADGTITKPIFLPMTTEQYIACYKRSEEALARSDDIILPNVFVDLSQIDSSDWNRPALRKP
ncbi:MAG: hypothetical protein ACREGG_03770 [Candidatus Saccharimonadales bacterium]